MEMDKRTYFITAGFAQQEEKSGEWEPIVVNSFSLQNKVGNQLINAQGIAVVTTERNVPNQKTFSSPRFEGKLKVWAAGGKLSSKTQKVVAERLEPLRNASNICRVDVRLIKPFSASKYLLKSIDKIIKAKIFTDWLLLKCEATNVCFQNVRDQVEIFSINDFRTLKHMISQMTCLPLPFIYKDQEFGTKYFFLNFNQAINSKISKLNERVFFDVERRDILIACDMGISLDESYVSRIKKFKIHVGKTLVNYVTQHMLEIKRLIVYNHILWGFLQDWIKRLHVDFCKHYDLEFIATSLSLHKINISDVKRLMENPSRPCQANPIFFVSSFTDFALYLRFTPAGQDMGSFAFEIDNIETPVVSTTTVVQYYRQFFYINDETKTNALECLLDYSSYNKNFLQVQDVVEYNKPLSERSGNVLNVQPAKIKARTVEEINKMLETRKEPEKEPEPEPKPKPSPSAINEETIMKLLKSGSVPKEQVKEHLLPFVRKCLDDCFSKNPVEIMNEDETSDTSAMIHKFAEAVGRADKTKTFHVFLDDVYNYLQLFFTNETSQKIMNCMIYKELENRFSNGGGSAKESVGEKELRAYLVSKTPENPLKRKKENRGEEPEPELDLESNPKMPNLMPLKKFLKLEREKGFESELKPFSVVLTNATVEEEEKSDENKNNLESQNFMVKFSKHLLKNPESEESCSTQSAIEPKSRRSWGDEKLYRECLTSKTRVVLHKLEEMVGLKNSDETVKLRKKRKTPTENNDLSILHECFDVSNGTAILKPGFECKNGSITKAPPPVKKEEIVMILRTSSKEDEPELLIIDEPDDIEIVQVKLQEKQLIKCGLCQKDFDSLPSLEEHEKSSHSDRITYKCNKCSKRFYFIHFLDYHRKTKHEKSLHCEYCHVTSQDNTSLEKHLKSKEHAERRLNHVVDIDS